MYTPHADSGRRASHRGFSLMELMVTVAILAIIAALAYPSYSAYVRRANRTDATSALIQAAQALQRCYSQSTTFSYMACTGVVPASSPNTYYSIAVVPTAPTSTALSTFLLTATPAKPPQTNDAQCTKFTLNSVGTQLAYSGTTLNTATCGPGN